MVDAAAPAEINSSGRVMFIRDADGELLIIKPGERIPVVAPSKVDDTAGPGEKEGFFSNATREGSNSTTHPNHNSASSKSSQRGRPRP